MVALKKQEITLETVWAPQTGPQTWLLTCPVFEVLFGGARGGGKSDGVLGEWASHADQYGSHAIGLCVRRERTQLTELIERSKMLYTPLGAKFHEQDKMWRFPNGARLRFAYLENDGDAQSYQGHSYTRVYVEEMGTFPNPDPIFKLMATLRSGAGVPCRFIATANPGGPGHLWIKQRYIDPAPLGMMKIVDIYKNPFTGKETPSERVFIPSRITDNKYTNTDAYVRQIQMSGNDELVKAWLLGDWNVTLGSYFPEWDTRKHVIKEFTVPRHWTRFMSMDWGSSKPFSVGWWAIVPDEFDSYLDIPYFDLSGKRIRLPQNALVRYREWYGSAANTVDKPSLVASENLNNKGIKLTVEEVAAGINIRERHEPKNEMGRAKMAYRVADPKMWSQDGGPSMVERLETRPHLVTGFIRADNKRAGKAGAMGGWDQVRSRLKGDGNIPMIYFMDCCKDAIRTLPAVQHNELNLEDVDTTGEDHAPDEIRYACMSRPHSYSVDNDDFRRFIKNRNNDSGVIIDDYFDEDSFNGFDPDKFNSARMN